MVGQNQTLSLLFQFVRLLLWRLYAVFAFLFGNQGCRNGTEKMGAESLKPKHKHTFCSGMDISKDNILAVKLLPEKPSFNFGMFP